MWLLTVVLQGLLNVSFEPVRDRPLLGNVFAVVHLRPQANDWRVANPHNNLIIPWLQIPFSVYLIIYLNEINITNY